MKRLVNLMSRWRPLWYTWMLLGTPLVILGFLLNVFLSTLGHFRAMWRIEWWDYWRTWFGSFGERHRRWLHSLAWRPPATGVVWRLASAPHEDVQ